MTLLDGARSGEFDPSLEVASSGDGLGDHTGYSPGGVGRRSPAPSSGRVRRLTARHPCVECGEPVVIEAEAMDIWCQPIAPTYTPYPQVLQRDCECGGHANQHIGLLLFDPRTAGSPGAG